jgi:hypothetical protein
VSVAHAPDHASGRLRAGLLALAAAGIVGTAAELAFLRHWGSLEQVVPWIALGLMAAAVASIAVRPSRSSLRAARGLSVLTLAAGAYGVVDHILENLHAGPLDATYGARWSAMGTASQWWHAATGGVGPAPTLAPAVLFQIALCLLLATMAHPASDRHDPQRVPAGALGDMAAG